MEKIILIYPDTRNNDSNLIAPLSLIYVATPLRKYYNTKMIDQRLDKDWKHTLKKELTSQHIICVGISSMTGPQITGGIEAARIIRKTSPTVPIVWGGVHPSLLPEEAIKNEFVDIVVIGDGEETFRELVEVLKNGGDKKSVKGIIYKHGNSVTRTPTRRQFPINTFDELAYDLIDVEKYKSSPLWTSKRSLPIITSRGCPYRCAYCYNTAFSNQKWISLSAEQTVLLILDLVKRYHVSGVFLLDDNFFVDLKRVKKICEFLIAERLNISIYNGNCRVDTIVKMDDALLTLIKKAGFDQLYLGVESGSNDVLKKIKKDITVEQVLIGNRMLKRANIIPFYSFMAGFPFETIEDIKSTLALMNCLLKENPEAIVYKLQLFTPFPGTELFNHTSRLGMKFPQSLEEWATFHYDRINYDGFSHKHKKFLENINYYTMFLDQKMLSDLSGYLKLFSSLYSKLLKFRIDRGVYSLMCELYLLNLGRNIRNRLFRRC